MCHVTSFLTDKAKLTWLKNLWYIGKIEHGGSYLKQGLGILESNLLNWDDLKVFLAITRAGTIRGAANLIKANHTTLSRRLDLFEDAVGSRLFDRSKQGLTLTQMGENLLPHALLVEEEMIAASRAIIGQDANPKGILEITMPHGLAMTSIMDDLVLFSETYLDIELNLTFSNQVADLTRREADVSLRIANEVLDDVVGRKLVQMAQAAYCTRSYAKKVKDNQGEGLEFIGWHDPIEVKHPKWLEQSCYPKARLKHRVNELVPMINLAASGLGLAYLACNLGDRHPDLIRAPFQHPLPYRYIWLLLHKDLKKTARVRLFVDFLANEVRKRKSEFWVAGTK